MSTKSTKKNTKGPKSGEDWHHKIAEARGAKWKENVLKGRREVLLNPSNIRILRLRKNIMQSALAGKLGMSESAYGAIERGHQPVQKDTALKISTLLGVPVAKLFKSEGKKFVAVVQKQTI